MKTYKQFAASLTEALNIDLNVEYGFNEPEYNDRKFFDSKFLGTRTHVTQFAFADRVYRVQLMHSKHRDRTELDVEFSHKGYLEKKMLPFTKKKKEVSSYAPFMRTGDNNALSVFSRVLSIAGVKAKEYNPDRIVFYSGDEDLGKAYLRIAQSKSGRAAAEKLGYYPSRHSDLGVIILMRKGLEDEVTPKKGKKGK